jgi:hypothetical protein
VEEFDVARIVLVWLWAFGLGCIEIEIEGGHGWAERLPTWYFKRGWFGRLFGLVMGHRPLTGYHVFVFTIPLVIVHLPFGFGLDWSVGAELAQLAIYFAIAVIWDYIWFVMNPAYTVRRFRRENVWWFQVPWIWRFPLDYYIGIGVSIAFAALAALAEGDGAPLRAHLWLVAGMIVLTALAVVAAPLYHRWYRYMRRAGADDRAVTPTFGPPAPEEVWDGGVPDLHPLGRDGSGSGDHLDQAPSRHRAEQEPG